MLGRRLDRHVLRSFLGPWLASLAGLAVLLVLFDLFDRIDECVALLSRPDLGRGAALQVIGTYYAGRTLAFLTGYGGLACLAGGALTVAVLNRNSELTAMRAAGISARRVFLPLLVFAGLAGTLQLLAAERAVSRLSPAADDALDTILRRKSKRGLNVSVSRRARLAVWAPGPEGGELPLWSGKAQVELLAGRVGAGGRELERLGAVITLDAREAPEGSLVYRLDAESAVWRGGSWHLTKARFLRYWGPQAVAGCSRLTCDITPTSLEAHALGLAGMGSGDLWELRNDTSARVELWQRLALPLANLILMLVGLPLAVAGSARGGRILPLVMALMLGALYVLAGEVGAQAARSGELLNFLERFRGGDWLTAMGGPMRLAVDLAMGLPHLVFLAVGTLLYWRVDR